jgi:hypothetical protein
VHLIHPHHPIDRKTDRGSKTATIRRHRIRIVADVVAQIESVEGRKGHPAGPGGGDASDADTHRAVFPRRNFLRGLINAA